MLKKIENNDNDPIIDKLNKKILAYNTRDKFSSYKEYIEGCQLLEEIDAMVSYLREIYLSSSGIVRKMSAIANWKGIEYELMKFGKLFLPGLTAEKSLIELNKSKDSRLLIEKNFIEIVKTSNIHPRYFVPMSYKLSPLDKNVVQHLKSLALARKKLDLKSDKALEYFYKLKKFRKFILHKLCFDLIPKNKVKPYRNLLACINHELFWLIDAVPTLKNRYENHKNVTQRCFGESLCSESQTKIESFVTSLRNAQNSNQIIQFPGLNKFDVNKLGGKNNVNWLLLDNQNSKAYVLRVEMESYNESIINHLRETIVNEYLSEDYATSLPTVDCPYRLFVTEYAHKGDLRSNSQKFKTQKNKSQVIQHGVNQISQLVKFCQILLSVNPRAMHTDIKLSNFLLNKEGKLIVADKKTIINISNDGLVLIKDIQTTTPYAPPEWHTHKSSDLIRAEPFMSYQIGLALYDYLVCPERSSNMDEPNWSEKKLDFDKAVFKTKEGRVLKDLISSLTMESPDRRLNLNHALKVLNQIDNRLKPQNELNQKLVVQF